MSLTIQAVRERSRKRKQLLAQQVSSSISIRDFCLLLKIFLKPRFSLYFSMALILLKTSERH